MRSRLTRPITSPEVNSSQPTPSQKESSRTFCAHFWKIPGKNAASHPRKSRKVPHRDLPAIHALDGHELLCCGCPRIENVTTLIFAVEYASCAINNCNVNANGIPVEITNDWKIRTLSVIMWQTSGKTHVTLKKSPAIARDNDDKICQTSNSPSILSSRERKDSETQHR